MEKTYTPPTALPAVSVTPPTSPPSLSAIASVWGLVSSVECVSRLETNGNEFGYVYERLWVTWYVVVVVWSQPSAKGEMMYIYRQSKHGLPLQARSTALVGVIPYPTSPSAQIAPRINQAVFEVN